MTALVNQKAGTAAFDPASVQRRLKASGAGASGLLQALNTDTSVTSTTGTLCGPATSPYLNVASFPAGSTSGTPAFSLANPATAIQLHPESACGQRFPVNQMTSKLLIVLLMAAPLALAGTLYSNIATPAETALFSGPAGVTLRIDNPENLEGTAPEFGDFDAPAVGRSDNATATPGYNAGNYHFGLDGSVPKPATPPLFLAGLVTLALLVGLSPRPARDTTVRTRVEE